MSYVNHLSFWAFLADFHDRGSGVPVMEHCRAFSATTQLYGNCQTGGEEEMFHNRPLILDFDADYRALRPFSGLGECTIEHAEELAARIEQIMDDIESLQ